MHGAVARRAQQTLTVPAEEPGRRESRLLRCHLARTALVPFSTCLSLSTLSPGFVSSSLISPSR